MKTKKRFLVAIFLSFLASSLFAAKTEQNDIKLVSHKVTFQNTTLEPITITSLNISYDHYHCAHICRHHPACAPYTCSFPLYYTHRGKTTLNKKGEKGDKRTLSILVPNDEKHSCDQDVTYVEMYFSGYPDIIMCDGATMKKVPGKIDIGGSTKKPTCTVL